MSWLMQAGQRDAVLEANRREQELSPGSSAALRTGALAEFAAKIRPDRAPRDHRRPDRFRRRAGRLAGPVEELGFDSLWVPEHTHLPVREDAPPRSSKACASTTTNAASTPSSRSRPRPPPPPAHRARDRHPACRPARPHRAGQAGRHPRSPLRRAGHLGVGLRLEPRRGRRPWSRLRPAPRRRPRARAAMEAIWSHEQAEFHGEFVDFEPTWSWPKPVQQPRVRTLIGGGAPTRSLPPSPTGPTDGSRSAAVGWARPAPPARPGEAAGRDPDALTWSPSAPSPTRASWSTTPGSGSARWCCASGPAQPEVRAQLETLAPLVPFAATLEHHDRPHRRPTPRSAAHAAARRSSAWTTTSWSRPTCGRPGCPRAFTTVDPRPSGAASARWSTSAAAPIARRSTPTAPRPTAGSTRTSSTSTSATWRPSASTVTT